MINLVSYILCGKEQITVVGRHLSALKTDKVSFFLLDY